ncbi:MAG: hypothetical protein ACI915_005419 [Gammaproteobacteria bacterium]|jgi:hypothetical protein
MKFAETAGTSGIITALLMLTSTTMAADHAMGFFITSVGVGKGADLGGLEGADAHCTKLAAAGDSRGREWRA